MKNGPAVLGTALAVFLGVIAPRLAALGSFPHMDEGFYALMAQYIHNGYVQNGAFPPDLGGYQLYPFLLAWIPVLPGNDLIWFRLADLFFAALAGCFFCRMLVEESGSLKFGLFLGLAFLLGMNVPDAIDAGFKHSFFPAFACLFLAVNITRSAAGAKARWFWAGVLVASGVLLRETFAPFALLGGASLLFARQWSALRRYILGGIFGAMLITVLCAVVRGQFWEIFAAYLQAADVYGPEAARVWPNFVEFGGLAFATFWPLLVLAVAGLCFLVIQPCEYVTGRAFFWLAAAILPIFEPFLKLGFLYHFSVCLPGVAGFCAYAYGRIRLNSAKMHRYACMSAALCALLMLPEMAGHYRHLPASFDMACAMPSPGWPLEAANLSQTLQAAQAIKRHMPEGGVLAANGFTFFLFPASEKLPAALWQADLARAYIGFGHDAVKMAAAVGRQPPDLVVIAEAVKPHAATFAPELRAIFANYPAYDLVERIEPDLNKNYGWLGYSLYRKTRPANP